MNRNTSIGYVQKVVFCLSKLLLISLYISSVHAEWAEFTSAKIIETSDYNAGEKIIIDNDDNRIITGEFFGVANIFGVNFSEYEGEHAYIAKIPLSDSYRLVRGIQQTPSDIRFSSLYISGLSHDRFDNFVVSGVFRGTIKSLTGEITSTANRINQFVAKYTPDGRLIWLKKINGDTPFGKNLIAIDDSGNIFLATNSFPEIGPESLISIIKLSSDGDILWSTSSVRTAPFTTVPMDIDLDSDGNIYIVGEMHDYNPDHVESENGRVFFAKFSSTGESQWERFYGRQHAEGFDLSIDSLDNVYLAGTFHDTIVIEGNILSAAGLEESPEDAFIAKFNKRGDLLWTVQSDSRWVNDMSIANDSENNVIVTVSGRDSLRSERRSHVAKYNSDGELIWTKLVSGAGNLRYKDVAVYSMNRIHLIGILSGNVNFSGIEHPIENPGFSTTFIAVLETRFSIWEITPWWLPWIFVFSFTSIIVWRRF